MIELRRVPDLWRRCDVTVRDLPLALLLIAGSLLPALQGEGTEVGDLAGRPFDGLAVVVVILECLPLAVRRRWPAGCLVLVSLGFAADQLRAYHAFAGTAPPRPTAAAGSPRPPAPPNAPVSPASSTTS